MKKIFKTIDNVEKYLIVTPFLLLGIFVVIEVFIRKFLGWGFSWLQETGRYIMVFTTFLGASIAVKQRCHPSMTALKDISPKKIKIVFIIVGNLLSSACFALVGYFSWKQFFNYKRIGTLTTSMWGLPVYVPFAIIPITTVMMSVRFLIQCYSETRDLLNDEDKHCIDKEIPEINIGEEGVE